MLVREPADYRTIPVTTDSEHNPGVGKRLAAWISDGDTWKAATILAGLALLVFFQIPACDKRRELSDAALLKRQYEFLAEYGIRGRRADEFLEGAEFRELDIGHPRGGSDGASTDE